MLWFRFLKCFLKFVIVKIFGTFFKITEDEKQKSSFENNLIVDEIVLISSFKNIDILNSYSSNRWSIPFWKTKIQKKSRNYFIIFC